MNSFYTPDELVALGLKSVDDNVSISRKASVYGAERIEIGNNVRIDDFCIISGQIKLGNYVHIAAQTLLFGGRFGIEMEDFTTFSSRCAVYAESDDYSGESLSHPSIPEPYRHPLGGKVLIERHSLIGSGSTVLPGITVGEGAAIGAMSLVIEDIPAWMICAGIPCKPIKARARKVLELERGLLSEIANNQRIP